MPALASGGRVLSALFMFLLFLAHSVSSEGVAGPPLAQFVAVGSVARFCYGPFSYWRISAQSWCCDEVAIQVGVDVVCMLYVVCCMLYVVCCMLYVDVGVVVGVRAGCECRCGGGPGHGHGRGPGRGYGACAWVWTWVRGMGRGRGPNANLFDVLTHCSDGPAGRGPAAVVISGVLPGTNLVLVAAAPALY